MFSECKNYLWERLGFPPQNNGKRIISLTTSELGISLIDWITGKSKFPWNILQSASTQLYDFNSEPWINDRVNAIKSYLIDYDIDKTLFLLNKSKNLAIESNADHWVVNDILVDIRNVEYAKMNEECIYFESLAQKEINSSKRNHLSLY